MPLQGAARKGRQVFRASLAAAILLAAGLAGCASTFTGRTDVEGYTDLDGYLRDPTGRNETAWPDLEGVTLTLLDNGAFSYTFTKAAEQFKALTGVTVKREDGEDTLTSLDMLLRTKS